jgi:acyl carrier protein
MWRERENAMTQDEVLVWLAEVFNEPPGSIAAETKKDDVAGWDSLGVLLLMADLDEKFSIQLDEKEIEGLQSVPDVIALLKRNGKLT